MRQGSTMLKSIPDGCPEAKPAIRITDLSKRFGTFTAVDNINADIARGEFFMIVGPSGCGKTTLLRILAGLENSTDGRIEIDLPPGCGRPVNSMVFQGDSLFPWMTVWDNAAYGLRMRNAPRPEIDTSVARWHEPTGATP